MCVWALQVVKDELARAKEEAVRWRNGSRQAGQQMAALKDENDDLRFQVITRPSLGSARQYPLGALSRNPAELSHFLYYGFIVTLD